MRGGTALVCRGCVSTVCAPSAATYERHRPETTALYEVVRDNLETLEAAIGEGALEARIPRHARRELASFLECGLLCRGFARFRCACGESRLVAFSCKGRGFCPSCLGRRMCATSADLTEHVLPASSGLRQWVLTFPFAWRARLGWDGALLRRLTRLVVATVLDFYAARAEASGRPGLSGAVTVVQRASSDLRLNPHLHLVVLDGAWSEPGGELTWEGLSHLRTREVGEVLERCVRRIESYLRRHRLLRLDDDEEDDPGAKLEASAVSGQFPPAGPQWVIGLAPLRPYPLAYDKPRCASRSGFTLHADTTAGALDLEGREALLRYVLRPPLASKRLELRPDGLVRLHLKKPFADGTLAVEMDPLSPLPPGHQRPAPAPAHRDLRGRARRRQPLEAAPCSRACFTLPDAPASDPHLQDVGRVAEADLRPRRPGVPALPAPHAPGRPDHQGREHRALPDRHRRGNRVAAALARACSAVLEEPRSPPSRVRRGR